MRAGRRKSTLNRLEQALRGGVGRYHRIGHDEEAIEALFVERDCQKFCVRDFCAGEFRFVVFIENEGI